MCVRLSPYATDVLSLVGGMGWVPPSGGGGRGQGQRCGKVSYHRTLFLNQLPLPWGGACIWALCCWEPMPTWAASSPPCWAARLLSHSHVSSFPEA